MSKSMDVRERFVELRARGRSFESIATELGIAKQTALNWARDLKTDIANAKALEWDAFRERCRVSRQHRLSAFCDHLERIRTELEKRDFSDVPTEKLVDLAMKLSSAIQEEDVPLEFIDIGFSIVDLESNTKWTA